MNRPKAFTPPQLTLEEIAALDRVRDACFDAADTFWAESRGVSICLNFIGRVADRAISAFGVEHSAPVESDPVVSSLRRST